MEVGGVDSDGREFTNATEMWKEHIGEEGDSHKIIDWYRNGVSYWQVSLLFFFSFFILLVATFHHS